MKNSPCRHRRPSCGLRTMAMPLLAVAALLPPQAHASFLSGDALDSAANVISWFALVIVPVVLVTAFWLVHILPEKIAEQRRHPQLAAIKVLCLLSLFFGGLLWPLAWLWAYTKPVFHKFAYGTDVADHPDHGQALTPLHDAGIEHHHAHAADATQDASSEDLDALRGRIRTLEAALAASTARAGDQATTGE